MEKVIGEKKAIVQYLKENKVCNEIVGNKLMDELVNIK